MITRKSSIHELELAGSNARFHVDLLTKAIYGATVPELLQKGVNVVSYYRTCPLCGAHLDPGEACDCVTVYTGHPGETYASMNIETGSISRCSIYIGKDEENKVEAYRRALAALEERIKEAAPGATNTGDGKAEQSTTAVSASHCTKG